jgi:outer membrane receptor protein involved in Fe transport
MVLSLVAFSPMVVSDMASGQSAAMLSGQVVDSSGAALPGAAVTISRSGGVPVRTVFTNDAGLFTVAGLTSGAYTVAVELTGFRTVSRAVVLGTAESIPLDLAMEVAGIAESVVVRGERAERSLRDTAASVAVFDEGMLEGRPLVASTMDLFARIPNVTWSGKGNIAPAVRGADGTGPAQGADAFFAGTRPRLNLQVDGRPASYNEVVFGDVGLWDVEQVEMFRGAQSTLQGRNAVAGTLVVRTKSPSYQPEASFRVGAGNLGTQLISGMVSGPLVGDRVAARLAFDRSTSDTFVDGFTGYQGVERPGEFATTTLRGKILVEPDPAKRFSTLFTVNHAQATGPQTEQVARPFGERAASFAAMSVFEPRSTGAIAESRWTMSPYVGYEHTLAYTSVHVERHAPPGQGNAVIESAELLFEPRVRFDGSRVRGFAGVYVFRADQDDEIDLFGGGLFDDRTRTVAGFGEVVLTPISRLDVTLGARLEREHRRRTGADGPFTIDFDETYNVFSPKAGVHWRASDAVSIGTVLSRGYNAGGAGFTYDFPFVSYTFSPEFVVSSETYIRADLAGGTLSLTGNAFVSGYTDMQLPFDLNADPDIWSFVVRNADAARTYGAEAGARWRAVPGLEVFGNLGLLQTEITEYPDSSVEGNRLAQAPSFTADLGAVYRHRNGFDLSLDTRYSDAYFSSVTNDPRGQVDPYAILNLQAGYRLGRARVFAFAKNVFDSSAAVLIDPGATPADDSAIIVRPRRLGIGLTVGVGR